MPKRPSPLSYLRDNVPFVTLVVLLIATVLMGGGSRDDILSLAILRPLAVICLGIGLITMTPEQRAAFKLPLGFMASILALIVLHMIPLPPFIWQALPGRELAVAAGEALGGTQPWRPISLVPYRTWNAFYAMLIPAAALVLAVQITREDHRKLLYLLIGAAMLSALWGMIQSIGGFSRGLYFYRVTNSDSPTGLFANRNHMAALQVCALPLLMLAATRAKGPRMRVVQIGCTGLGALAIMMATATGSRAGIALSLVALLACWLVWRARPIQPADKRRRERRQTWVPYALGSFGALLLGGFAFLLTRSQSFTRISGGSTVEEYRFTVWESVVEFLPQYLPFGSGIGSFVEVFQVHEPRDLLSTSFWNHAHNDWLEWILEGGIPIIILLAFAMFAYSIRMARLFGRSKTGQFEVQLGIAGGVVLFVLGLWSGVDYPLRVPMLSAFAAIASVWLAMPDAGRGLRGSSGTKSDDAPDKVTAGSFETRPAREYG
ncbi:MAG: O-antigen ligase family protein [Pseudomonadota bacterium]